MKAIYVRMMDLYLIFQFVKGSWHGNQIILARLTDVSVVLFCYYLLGGDTAAPSRLYARLCHAFSSYLSFSPLGKPTERAIYFTLRNFFLFFFFYLF